MNRTDGKEEILQGKRNQLEQVNRKIASINEIRQLDVGVNRQEVRKKEDIYNTFLEAHRQGVRDLENGKRGMEQNLAQKKQTLYTIERDTRHVREEIISLNASLVQGKLQID